MKELKRCLNIIDLNLINKYMSYFSLFDYTKWYNWYYGIEAETPVVAEGTCSAEATCSVERIDTCGHVGIAELETQKEEVPVVSKKKSTFRNYHLRK